MKGRLLLDIVIGQSASILELLASEDQALLIWWNTTEAASELCNRGMRRGGLPFFILDLCLDIVDGIGGFNLQSDGLSCERLHKDLHDKLVIC